MHSASIFRRRPTLAGLLLTSGLLTGCDLLTGPDDEEDLADARRRWAAEGYVSYSYELVRSCFCGYPAVGQRVVVVVNDDHVVAAWLAATGENLPPEELAFFPTVPDLFDLAEEAIHEADRLTIGYDRRLGYPTLLDIDWIRNAIDDELHLTASNLVGIQ